MWKHKMLSFPSLLHSQRICVRTKKKHQKSYTYLIWEWWRSIWQIWGNPVWNWMKYSCRPGGKTLRTLSLPPAAEKYGQFQVLAAYRVGHCSDSRLFDIIFIILLFRQYWILKLPSESFREYWKYCDSADIGQTETEILPYWNNSARFQDDMIKGWRIWIRMEPHEFLETDL